MNILSLLDNPTSGDIFYNGKKVNNFSKKRKISIYKDYIGFVFQNYYLNENLNVIENVMSSLLIRNYHYNEAYSLSKSFLISIGIDEHLFNQEISKCSGGEKQRIALARSLIYSPPIIFLDEPTGALDDANSEIVLEIVKKASLKSIVILVSHNQEIIKKYGDKIITLSDGKIINIEIVRNNKCNKGEIRKYKKRSSIKMFLIKNNFKKRKKDYLFIIICLSLSISFFTLCFSFFINKDKGIINQCNRQFDYPSFTITKEEKVDIDSTNLKLIKNIRPSRKEINSVDKFILDKFIYDYNFDYLFLENSLNIGEKRIIDTSFSPIYSFSPNYINSSLLIKGRLGNDSFNEIVINELFYNDLKDETGYGPIGSILDFSNQINLSFNVEKEDILDNISLKQKFKIVGVIKEFSFLNTKKIYYSFLGLKEKLTSYTLNNLSLYFNKTLNVIDYYSLLSDYDYISMYSYRGFLKSLNYLMYFKEIFKQSEINEIKFTSLCYNKENTFLNLLSIASLGLYIFLFIAGIGTILFIALFSLFNFIKDKRNIALNMSLGLNIEENIDIYCYENIFLSLLALIISFPLSMGISKIINLYLYKKIRINNFIELPFKKFLNVPFLFPILLFFIVILIIYLSSQLPLLINKKISIKEELKSED